jgi:hypothetical protein
MLKTELVSILSQKYYKVGSVGLAGNAVDQAAREREGVRWYIAGVYEQNGDALVRKNVPFYVANEGQPNETAFLQEPIAVATPDTFREGLETFLNGEGVLGYVIRAVDAAQKTATVQATVISGDARAKVENWFIKQDKGWTKYLLE